MKRSFAFLPAVQKLRHEVKYLRLPDAPRLGIPIALLLSKAKLKICNASFASNQLGPI
jgi:hypothetical protein